MKILNKKRNRKRQQPIIHQFFKLIASILDKIDKDTIEINTFKKKNPLNILENNG